MKHRYWLTFLVAALLFGGTLMSAPARVAVAVQDETDRITVDELKSMLARHQPVTIIDVRLGSSYTESENKIKGAIRIDPADVKSSLNKIPRHREIVTYCT